MNVLRTIPLSIALLAPAFAWPADPSQQPPVAASGQAVADRQLIEMLEAADSARPAASIRYLLAETAARLGDREKVLANLERVVASGVAYAPPAHSALWRYASDPEAGALLSRLAERIEATFRGEVLHRIGDGSLRAEGIAYDPETDGIFVGDAATRSILRIDRAGNMEPLATGLPTPPLGMAVDRQRRILWVAAADPWPTSGATKSRLYRIDLRTREVSALNHDGFSALNDVCVAADGTVYATDSGGGMVWRVAADGSISKAARSHTLSFPNGIAIAADGKSLYLAQGRGLSRLDLATGTVSTVSVPPQLDTFGIDGLYRRGDTLYAVQNLTYPGRVLRMHLDEAGGIGGHEILDVAHPDFDMPTTGAVTAGGFIVIANSQLYKLREGSPGGGNPLVIIRYPHIPAAP